MRTRILLAAMLTSLLGLSSLAQTPTGPVHVVTHIDIMPAFAASANDLLAQYARETRTDADLIRYDLLVQDSRPNHFVAVEVWKSRQTFEDHGGHVHSVAFREKLQPMLGSPLDVRLHSVIE